jgi:hypothetical protein
MIEPTKRSIWLTEWVFEKFWSATKEKAADRQRFKIDGVVCKGLNREHILSNKRNLNLAKNKFREKYGSIEGRNTVVKIVDVRLVQYVGESLID